MLYIIMTAAEDGYHIIIIISCNTHSPCQGVRSTNGYTFLLRIIFYLVFSPKRIKKYERIAHKNWSFDRFTPGSFAAHTLQTLHLLPGRIPRHNRCCSCVYKIQYNNIYTVIFTWIEINHNTRGWCFKGRYWVLYYYYTLHLKIQNITNRFYFIFSPGKIFFPFT